MYAPPQNNERPSYPHAFLFSPVGVGKKERREQWVWKGEINEPSSPKPFSYEYVVEDGKLPTIAVHHPANYTTSAPLQRKLSKRMRPRLERHSSPASTGQAIPPPLSPRSSTRPATKLKRVLSLTSMRVPRSSFDEDKKQLTPVPRIESTILSDAMVPTFGRTFFGVPEADRRLSASRSADIPPRRPRRPSVIQPGNATPRIPKAPQITPTSFPETEDSVSPVVLTKDLTQESAPTQVRNPSPGRLPERTQTLPKLSVDTQRALLPRVSKFKEHIDSPQSSVDHPPLKRPSAAVKEPLPSAAPALRHPQPRTETVVAPKTVRIDATPRYTPVRQLPVTSKPSTPSKLVSSAPRRAATVRTPTSAQSGRSMWADAVCTAEARPVLFSPIVASGTARLVSC